MKAIVAAVIMIGMTAQGLMAASPDGPAVPAAGQDQAALAPSSLAEQYLFQLSDKMKKRRRLGGTVGMVVGAASVAGGLALTGMDEEEDPLGLDRVFGAVMVAEGAVAFGAGAYVLAVKTRAERAYARIRAVSDAAERELAAEQALADVARKARTARMIQGGVGIAIGVTAMILAEDASGGLAMAAWIGGLAAYSFLVKSPEEKAHRSYEERRGLRSAPDLVFGITPRGGVLAGLALSF